MNSSFDAGDLFPRGTVIQGDHFKGTAWLEMLITDPVFNCPIGRVTFEPGARNSWHKHPGGQILLATSGSGFYQERGKPARRLGRGDVVKILPNVEHWHGAGLDSSFSHIAITTNPQKGDAVWMEPLSDEEYRSAIR